MKNYIFETCVEQELRDIYLAHKIEFDELIANGGEKLEKEILKLVIDYSDKIYNSDFDVSLRDISGYMIFYSKLDNCRTQDGKKLSSKQINILDKYVDDVIEYISSNYYADISEFIGQKLEEYTEKRKSNSTRRTHSGDIPSDLEFDVYGSSDWFGIND